jgi:hypothetical protein
MTIKEIEIIKKYELNTSMAIVDAIYKLIRNLFKVSII